MPRAIEGTSLLLLLSLMSCLGGGGAPPIDRPYVASWDAACPLAEAATPLPEEERLSFDCTLAGIPAGRAELRAHVEGEDWVLHLEGSTAGLVDLLVSVRAEATSHGDAERSHRFHLRSSERGKVHERRLEYGAPTSIWWRDGETDAGSRMTVADAVALDPLRLLWLLRRLPPTAEREIRFLSGSTAQSCRSFALGRRSIESPVAGPVEADVLELRLGPDEESTRREHEGRASVWWLSLGPAPQRVPYRLEHDTPLGRLRIDLVERTLGPTGTDLAGPLTAPLAPAATRGDSSATP